MLDASAGQKRRPLKLIGYQRVLDVQYFPKSGLEEAEDLGLLCLRYHAVCLMECIYVQCSIGYKNTGLAHVL